MDRNHQNQLPPLPPLTGTLSDLLAPGKPMNHFDDLDFSGRMEQELLTENIFSQSEPIETLPQDFGRDKPQYSYEDEYGDDFSSDEGNSGYLCKRKDMNGDALRKKRLKGTELIESLRNNKMFKDHAELFQEGLDDYQRRKMMQKIRNRVSAQESRDRKKMQYHGLEELNDRLRKENTSLKSELEAVKAENANLKIQIDNLKKQSTKASPTESTYNESDSQGQDSQSRLGSEQEEYHSSSPVLTRRNSGSSDFFGKSAWNLPTFLVLAFVCLLCFTAPGIDQGADSGIVKSSAIVPLAGAGSMSLYSPNHYKSLMKLNAVCDVYCEEKQKALQETKSERIRRVSNRILALPNDEILRKNGTIDLIYNHEGLDNHHGSASGLIPQNRPFSTMMCGKVEWIDNQPSSKLIHMILKKDKNDSLQMQDMLDALPAGSQIDDEYVSLVAEIKSQKDIRFIKHTPVDDEM